MTTPSGPHWLIGVRSWRPITTRPSGCWGPPKTPTMTPSDQAMLEVAGEMGVADSFHMTPVGVAFGPAGTTPAGAAGRPVLRRGRPARRSCLECGECMTGCRHGAKNTLLTNYLYLAERAGAVVVPLTTARSVATHRRRGLGGGHGRHRVVGGLAPRAPLAGRACRAGRGGVRDPAAAPRHGHGGQAPRPVPPAGAVDPHQFRVAAGGRCRPGPAAPRFQPRRSHNFVLSPRARYPRRARPLRAGLQHDGPFRHFAGGRPRRLGDPAPRVAAVPACRRPPTAVLSPPARPAGLVRAHRYRPGHAVPGQFPRPCRRRRRLAGRLPADDQPGARPAQPDLAARRP